MITGRNISSPFTHVADQLFEEYELKDRPFLDTSYKGVWQDRLAVYEDLYLEFFQQVERRCWEKFGSTLCVLP